MPALHAALLPLDAPELLPNVRDALDDDVRAGLQALGVDVQAREVTLRSVRDAAGAGLDCTLTSADCAIRVGLVAEVQAVVTVSIASVADRLVLRGALLDVNQVVAPRRVAAVVVLPGIDGGKSLAHVLARLVTGTGDAGPLPVRVDVAPPGAALTVDGAPAHVGLLWVTPGLHDVTLAHDGYMPFAGALPVREDEPVNTWTLRLEEAPQREPPTRLYVGLGLSGAGVLLAGAGAATAAVVEVSLDDAVVWQERLNRRTTGGIALVAAGVGVASLVAGTALAITGAVE